MNCGRGPFRLAVHRHGPATQWIRAHHDGPIIAVDVCAEQAAMTIEPGSSPPIGLRHLLRRRFDRIAEASEIGYGATMTALAGWTAP